VTAVPPTLWSTYRPVSISLRGSTLPLDRVFRFFAVPSIAGIMAGVRSGTSFRDGFWRADHGEVSLLDVQG
jgi:hypothetical protein